MHYTARYDSPVGKIVIFCDGTAITGLWFEGQKHYAAALPSEHEEKDIPALNEAKKWLDVYFSGKEPDFTPPIALQASPFRMRVWERLRSIPYGDTVTYGNIAKQIEKETGKRVSAQAVGNAVGHNPISIIVPCHRVMGANGRLTGYAGGIDKKILLLKNEGLDTAVFRN